MFFGENKEAKEIKEIQEKVVHLQRLNKDYIAALETKNKELEQENQELRIQIEALAVFISHYKDIFEQERLIN